MRTVGFEALDAVGKTTTAERLARVLGGIVATSPVYLSKDMIAARKVVNAGDDIEARFAYFVSLNDAQMRTARQQGKGRRVATLDSTIFRTIATHRVLGSKTAMATRPGRSLKPDYTYYLDLDEGQRQARMLERDGQLVHPSKWDELLFDRQDALREEYASFGLCVIDASQDTDAIIDAVMADIQV